MKRLKKSRKDAPTQGDAFVTIAQEGGDDALKLVGDIMERSAIALDRQLEGMYEDERRAHDDTRARLARSERRLGDLEARIAWLMGGDMPISLRDEIEAIVEDVVSEAELRVR